MSSVRDRIYWLLKHRTDGDDAMITNYQSLVDASAELFSQRDSPLLSNSIPSSCASQKCCQGIITISVDVDDSLEASKCDKLQENFFNQLKPKPESEDKQLDEWCEPPSWCIIDGSSCLEPNLLEMFLQLKNHNTPLLSYTFTVLCFLGDERQLFENCILQSTTLHDYESIIYPDYQRRIKAFFSILNSNSTLQKRTLLVEQYKVSSDEDIRLLLRRLLQNDAKFGTEQETFRRYMANLLSSSRRTVHDIRAVRRNVLERYNRVARDRLKSLLQSLGEANTAESAARQLVQIVLVDFERMDQEELRTYQRQMTLGFDSCDSKESSSIAAELIRYALNLIKKQENAAIQLLYSIILTICSLASHRFFHHDLFNYTPEIFQLSMSLLCQRQYVLVLAGFRLCGTILNGDRVEHKYAIAYLKNDALAARKMMDALTWLLSPFQAIQIEWEKQAEGNDVDTTESNEEALALKLSEKACFQHSVTLVNRQYVRCLALLLHGCFEHCTHITVNDIHVLIKTIDALANPGLAAWRRNEKRYSLMLIVDLCTILYPILQYGLPEVSSAIRVETLLLYALPKAIRVLLPTDNEFIDPCVRFYMQLIQSKRKDNEPVADTESERQMIPSDKNIEKLTQPPTTEKTESMQTPPIKLNLSRGLISSYFDLNCKYHKTALQDKTLLKNKAQTFLDMQWEKFNVLQLNHDNELLKQEHIAIQQEMSQLRGQLHRTKSDRDQLRIENARLIQEIDRLKSNVVVNASVEMESLSMPVPVTKSIEENNSNELVNLSPHEITAQQAEKFIREIHYRRTSFNDYDMRKSICGSLKHLGSNLYTSPVHFLHELIQNAEDNVYDPSITPHLRVVINHDSILLSNNEQGLRAHDVLAICSLAVSTKRQDKHLGQKGVGFKSVFAASNQPTLISQAWKFSFQVPGLDAMSCITPIWTSDQAIPEEILSQIAKNPLDTHLYLPLKLQRNTPASEEFLNQVTRAVDPCILLNLRWLKKLEIIDRRRGQVAVIEKKTIHSIEHNSLQCVIFEDFRFANLTESLIELRTATGQNNFRVYSCDIAIPESIEQGPVKKTTTRLMLAFPCDIDYDLTYTVYVGLPVCDLGFNFLLNADFHLVTNRESVREDAPINAFLRDHFATLFVYLLLKDVEIRKNMNRYCPSSTTSQIKHSSWWLVMVDRINELIMKHFSTLFSIETGKLIRRFNADLAALVSNEQLYDCADIQVVNSADGLLTDEQLKAFQVEPVSLIDVLNCFPDREAELNAFRVKFQQWTQQQCEDWWNQLFRHIGQVMTDSIGNLIFRKPIFLLETNFHRQYLPLTTDASLLLFVTDDNIRRMWKHQIILLQYTSIYERNALLKSSHVQLLTEDRLIDIILHDHLQTEVFSNDTCTTDKRIQEIWQDLIYLRSRFDRINKATRFIVPVTGSRCFSAIQDATLPTILGVEIQRFLDSSILNIVRFPYFNVQYSQLDENLEWEHFFLQMHCQPPSIYVPLNLSITKLPILRSFTMFTSGNSAKLAEIVFSNQLENTQDSLRQFPIIAHANDNEQISPISTTFDETIAQDLASLPRVIVPSHCRILATMLGVCVSYELKTCVTVLQLLSNEKNTNLELYIEWLGHLQVYIRQQRSQFIEVNLLSSCEIYLPDQQQFCPLKDLLIVQNNIEHCAAVTLVSKYLKLQIVSPSVNQVYWQFKDLFYMLKCTSAAKISHIIQTIHLASCDMKNYHARGDCNTILTEIGTESMIALFQYLETLILECVKQNRTNDAMLQAIVKQRRSIEPCGSLEDWQWRFGFTCNSISEQLLVLIGIHQENDKIPILTIDQQLIVNSREKIVYACMEQKIIQNFSKSIGKRCFVLPLITRTCPLVLAALSIDYVERRGIVEWHHRNNNLEHHLGQLTNIFRQTLEDSELEVITSKYAVVNLLLSDSGVLNTDNRNDWRNVDSYAIDIDFPFWIFNKTILVCIGMVQDDTTKSVIATSALTTLLHKRKLMSFEEAKLLARQKIDMCTSFQSNQLSSVASAKPGLFSYVNLLFPTDHQSIEPSTILMGKQFIVEQDPEDHYTNTVAVDRAVDDRVYRSRVKEQNHHIQQNKENPNVWTDPIIVDSMEQIRIGQNAEHFFFIYLQEQYGPVDVTPIRNWCSSNRLKAYPCCLRGVDDSVGYDFHLQDTREIFVRGCGRRTKRCYFEVKGTSGSFNPQKTRFHITENELSMCRTIAYDERRLETEAYLIVIVQYCLDSEKISLGTIIDWSQSFESIRRTVDSYTCSIVSMPSMNINDTGKERRNYHQQQHVVSQDVRYDDRSTNIPSKHNQTPNSNVYTVPQRRSQQPKQPTDSARKRSNKGC